jgi:excisionase family DNA binding protein
MSEAELHLIRNRLNAGLRHKAAKGELRKRLPVGLVHDDAGAVVMDPDESVREAILTVFRLFEDLGSARQVMMAMRADGLLLPRRPTGSHRVGWEQATYGPVREILTNPAYAGAFVFGRSRTEKRIDNNGKLAVRTRLLPQDEWEVLIRDHHPGYLTWERYQAVQDELRANWRPPLGQAGGAAREGTALLQGRIRCGRCGRMMQVGYSGPKGKSPRYICGRAHQLCGSGICQSIGGRSIEKHVLDKVFAVLEPAALAATVKALEETGTVHAHRAAAFELAVERARYESDRARRQFDAVEPENRLVGRTLEAAWEQSLSALRRAEADLAAQQARRPATLSAEEVAWAGRAGADVRAIFASPTTTQRERKQLVRAVLAEVIVTVRRDDRQADLRVLWEGGATTDLTMDLRRPGARSYADEEETVELVRRLVAHYDDATIAMVLGRQGRLTATGLRFTKRRVALLRTSQGIAPFVKPITVGGPCEDAAMVPVAEAGRLLGVSKETVYRWLRDGFIAGEQDVAGGPWRVRVDDAVRAKVVGEAPAGWAGLAEAAARLGTARQTVLDRVRRGELRAVYVDRGRRRGLAIDVASSRERLPGTVG